MFVYVEQLRGVVSCRKIEIQNEQKGNKKKWKKKKQGKEEGYIPLVVKQ